MAKSAEEAKKIVQNFYSDLLKVLPITELVKRFYSRQLLSDDHKSKLDSLTARKEKSKYFLDELLIVGLKINYTGYFDEMIAVMKESDDTLARHLVKELMPTVVSPTLVLSPTSPTTSVTTDTGSKQVY